MTRSSRFAGLADLAPPPVVSEALASERAATARFLAGDAPATRLRLAPPAPSTRRPAAVSTVRRAA